jgi:hypothetical protein
LLAPQPAALAYQPEVVSATHSVADDGLEEHRDGWVVFDRPIDHRNGLHHFVDITANPAFARDREHRWLVGRLEAGRQPGDWSLRYASVTDDDPYDGRVTLLSAEPLTGFHAG